MVRKIIFTLVFLILLFPLISSAQPSFQKFISGYDIKIPTQETLIQGRTYDFRFHVFNISNGVPIDNSSTDCFLHLYDNSGEHILNQTVPHELFSLVGVTNEWAVEVGGANFTKIGSYNYIIQCNSTVLGGYTEFGFEVTPSGKEFSIGTAIIYSTLLFIFILIIVGLVFVIGSLPKSNESDEEGKLISISWLKYLRGSLWFVEYILVVAVFYIISNLSYAFLSEELFANVFFTLYRVLFILAPVIMIIWISWIFVKIFQDKKFWGMMQRGMFPQGRM